MKLRLLALFIYLAFSSVVSAADDPRDTAPILDHQVEPEWEPQLQTSFLLTPVKVEMVIDPHGVPFSLSSQGLPDNLVPALAEWRFRPGKKNGKESAFAMTIYVQNRTALTPAAERSLRRRWFAQSKDLGDALIAGAQLDQAGAARVASLPQSDPQSPLARPMLLAYAAGPRMTSAPEQARISRLENIAWLVEHEPDSQFMGSPLVLINSADGPLADKAGYEQVRKLWLRQLAEKPEDPAIVEHAIHFIRVADPYATEAALIPIARNVYGAADWLGELYGLAALHVTGVDLQSGLPVASVENSPFAAKAMANIAASKDPRIVLSAAAAIVTGGRALSKSGHLPADFPATCVKVVAHAKELYPQTIANCDLSADDPYFAPPVGTGQPERIRVGGNVQKANLIKKAVPTYPAAAKARGIQGAVEFTAVIAKSGKIQSLIFLSGPLALYEPARAAVSQWEYRPTLLNGRPVEVITRISVNYELRSQ